MTADEIAKVIEARIQKVRAVLTVKAGEYATDDRLHNFKTASSELGGCPTEACWGYLKKHLISIRDMALGVRPSSPMSLDEKITDAIVYLLLMEALFAEVPPVLRAVPAYRGHAWTKGWPDDFCSVCGIVAGDAHRDQKYLCTGKRE